MDATRTVELAEPVEFGGKSYDKLDLREPTAGEYMKAMRETGFKASITLVALVAGHPPGAVEKMPLGKVLEADRFLSGFIEPGPTTGGN